MYNLTKNNYHLNPKSSNIYTPSEVSEFIFNLLKDKIDQEKRILDPCAGQGSLLTPWKKGGYKNVIGIDLDKNSPVFWNGRDFLKEGSVLFASPKGVDEYTKTPEWTREYYELGLVLCNPPFNGYGNKLGSEVWLDKIIELFGKDIPIVLFAPMGFRLNGKKNGQRWTKFTSDKYPAISSIISLPRDIFPEVEFHSEILIFNIKGLEPHYFYQPNYE